MTGSSAIAGVNPFVGPHPLETGQRIFGRDREIEELYYLLSAERIVVLHSPSGAGKSSLIRAGLIPRLAERFDVRGPTRVNTQPPEGAAVNRYVRSANLGFEQGLPEERRRADELVSRMTLADYVESRPRRRSAPHNVVLIFDQFEEILTTDPLAFDAKHEFFRQLGELLQDPKIWALFALREDYLAPLDPYADQIPTHLKNRFRVDLLSRAAAKEAMVGTAAEGRRTFAQNAVEQLARDLATMQVQQPDGRFESQVGPNVEPLHLQVACRGLWERMPANDLSIDLEDIKSFGDVTQALAMYYEGVVGAKPEVQRVIREWVGENLITKDGIRSQVLRGAGASEGLDNELIAGLVNSHLVRSEQRSGALWYELAHDRLIEPVRRNNEDWFDAHLSKVQKVAALWETQGRPPGLLVVGKELAEAQRWASTQTPLTEGEKKFLAASAEKQAAVDKERRQARRLRWLTYGSVVLAVIAAAAAVVAGLKAQEASRQAETALSRKLVADARLLAESPLGSDLAKRGALLAAEALRRLPERDQFQVLWLLLKKLPAPGNISDGMVTLSVAFSPDGKHVVSGRLDNTARVTVARDGKELAQLRMDGPVTSVAFSPDGQRVMTGSDDKTARVWDARTGKELLLLAHEGWVSAVAFSPDGQRALIGSLDNTARLWDLQSRKELLRLGHDRQVTSVAFSPDGRQALTGSLDNTARLWDAQSGRELLRLRHDTWVRSVAFSPDGQRMLTGSGPPTLPTSTVILWDTRSGKEVRRFTYAGLVSAVVFSHDGQSVLAGGDDRSVRLWDLQSGKEMQRIPHDGWVRSIAISPDNQRVLVSSPEAMYDFDAPALLARVCALIGRDLTHDEWAEYLRQVPYRETCSLLERQRR